MKRISAHRFLVIPTLCVLAGTGCSTKGDTKDEPIPEDVPPAAVAEPPAPDKIHIEETAGQSGDAGQIPAATADEERSVTTTDNDIDTVTEISQVEKSAEDTVKPPIRTDPEPSGASLENGNDLADTPAEAAAQADPDPSVTLTADDGDPADEHEVIPRPTFDEQRPCVQPIEEAAAWIDKSQVTVYQTICGTVAWFDGFFGDRRYDSASKETFGRISLSGFWDQYDGFNPRLRFRAKLALPALNERTNLIIGRGDERELIEGQQQTPSDTIPNNFNGVDDDSFLFGLGYRKGSGLKRGFDLSVGVKVRAPPEPYIKGKYRRAWQLSDSTLFRLSPIVYWKYDEGIGATLNGNLDHLLTEKFMIRWSAGGNISQDNEVEGVAWNNWFSLFQALADKKAISYHTFVTGETKAEIQTQNFGVEVRFRRKIFRKWLFLELVSSLSWPRFLPEETRESNIGIGAGFEMYFGPVPEYQIR